MKKIYWCLLGLMPVCGWAQQGFRIEGELKNVTIGGQYVYLAYAGKEGSKLDSAQVSGGKYVFQGEIAQPGMANLFSVSPMTIAARNVNNRVGIYLLAEHFAIRHVDSFRMVGFEGSVANTEFAKIKAQMEPILAKQQTLGGEYRKAAGEGNQERAEQLKKELQAMDRSLKEDILFAYAQHNPNSPVALFALQSSAGMTIDPNVVGPVFDKLAGSLRDSEEGKDFAKKIAAARLTAVGAMAPVFTQNDTLGKPVSLASFRGSYVLIDFWASWCVPCRQENPAVVVAFNRYKDKGFKVLSVSLDKPEAKDKWIEAIHKDGLNWTHVSDLQFWNNAVAKQYNISAIPNNFLVDPNGKIVAKGLRGEELEKELEKVYH